ncbi:MAG: PEGA domain-containing protein [Planctomycetota bacterium]
MTPRRAALLALGAGGVALLVTLGLASRDQRSAMAPAGVAGTRRDQAAAARLTTAPTTSSTTATTAPHEDATDRQAVPVTADRPAGAPEPWHLRGRVFDADGQLLGGTDVGVIALAGGVPAEPQRVVAGHSDRRGAFDLEIPVALRDTQTALVARQAGQRPATRPLFLSEDACAAAHDLHLTRGHSITGSVMRDGDGVQADLAVDLRFGVRGVFGVGREAFWIDGRLEEKHAEAQTDAKGRFALHGLGPHEHQLTIGGSRDQIGGLSHQVRAPGQIVIDLTQAILEVAVTRDGTALRGAWVEVTCDSGSVRQTTTDATLEVRVPPQAKVSLLATHPTGRAVRRDVQSPARGQRLRVAMELPAADLPGLCLVLRGASTARVHAVRLHLAATGRRSRLGPLQPARSAPKGAVVTEFDARRRAGSEEFSVDAVPAEAGPYRLRVLPERTGGDPGHYVMPLILDVEIPERGVAVATGEVRLGARLDLQIEATGDAKLRATYSLIATDGEKRLQGVHVRNEGRSYHVLLPRGRSMFLSNGASDLAKVHGLVAAGTYRLVIRADGFAPYEARVTLAAGETTAHRVKLNPTKGP